MNLKVSACLIRLFSVGAMALGVVLCGSAKAQVFDKTTGNVHTDVNGTISMEMEHAAIINKWISTSGKSGTALTCPVNGGHTYSGLNHTFARFVVRFGKAGKYTIWTLAKAGLEGTSYYTNEFNMRIDPNTAIQDPITRLDEGQPAIDFKLTKDPNYVIPSSILNAPSTLLWLSRMPQDRNGDKFSKMRVSEADAAGAQYGWRSLAKSKRPYQRGEPVGVMCFDVKTAGEHIIEVYGNGETGWTIDKIVLQLNSTTAPSGTGPAETMSATGTRGQDRGVRFSVRRQIPSATYNVAGRRMQDEAAIPMALFTGKKSFAICGY